MSDLIFLKPASGNYLNLTKLKSLKNLTFFNYEDSSFLPILSVFDQLEEVDINGLDVSSRSINSISTKIIRLDELTIKEDIFIQDVNWQALVIERTKGEGKIFFKNLIQLKKVRVNEYDKHVDYQSLFNQPNLETIYIKDEDFLQKLLKHDNIQNPILTIKYLRFEVSESDKEILKKRFKRVEKLNPKKEVFF